MTETMNELRKGGIAVHCINVCSLGDLFFFAMFNAKNTIPCRYTHAGAPE